MVLVNRSRCCWSELAVDLDIALAANAPDLGVSPSAGRKVAWASRPLFGSAAVV